MTKFRLRAYSLLILVALIWGVAGPVIKITLGKISPDLFILYRFLISTIVALPFLIFKKSYYPKDIGATILVFIYSLFNSSISLGLLFWGTSKTSLLDMSLISLFGPLLMAISGYLFLHDKITKREKIGILVGFIGSAIIGLGPIIGKNQADGQIIGNLLVFLSLVSGAASGVLLKKLLRMGFEPGFLANISFVIGFITVLIFVILKDGITYALSPLSNSDLMLWGGIVYMAVFSGNLAYTFNNMGQKTIELSEAAPFSYLHPIFSAAIAVMFLGDKLTSILAFGSVITFVGVFLAEIKKRRYNP